MGLLENPVDHPWWPVVRGVGASVRMSVAGSLFLFRKVLPCSGVTQAQVRSHRANLCLDPSPVNLPPGYLAHARRIARECFPNGWDRSYEDLVWGSTPSVSACLESPRSRGGARGTAPCRSSFLSSCLGDGPELDIRRDVKFSVVSEGGKDRGVTVASAELGVLRPLHKALYNQLSTFPWLLRGEAKPGKFRGFHPRAGEVFVSGDYESATDHLPLEVAEALLESILWNSSWVPHRLARAAVRSLRSVVHYEDSSVGFEQVCGQLMGNLLSFPLLCLQNYVAFRWCFDRSRPVRINGDDIVFRCSRAEFDRWAAHVSDVGLKLSRGKTLLDARFFSVNSHFFRSRRSKPPSLVPVLRTGGLAKRLDTLGGVGASYSRFLSGFVGLTRDLAGSMFLRASSGALRASGRSVIRGLGVPASVGALQRAGLWRRECWYGELPREAPLPADPCRLLWASIPEGWERRVVGSAGPPGADVSRAFVRELVASAWEARSSRGCQVEQYWRDVRGTGWESSYHGWRLDKRVLARERFPLFRGLVGLRLECRGGAAVRAWGPRTAKYAWYPKECVVLGDEECAAREWAAGFLPHHAVPPPLDYSPVDLFGTAC